MEIMIHVYNGTFLFSHILEIFVNLVIFEEITQVIDHTHWDRIPKIWVVNTLGILL